MRAGDRVERLVRGRHDVEVASGADPVIDFNCAPDIEGEEVTSRFDVLRRLDALRSGADGQVGAAVDAPMSYLGALLGERRDLDSYVRRTRGFPAIGWTAIHLERVIDAARDALARVDVAWNARTRTALNALSPDVDAADAGEVICGYAAKYEPAVRDLTGATADFELDACCFALHEVLGRVFRCANLTATAESLDVDWSRHLAIHCPHQVLFEGLARSCPSRSPRTTTWCGRGRVSTTRPSS